MIKVEETLIEDEDGFVDGSKVFKSAVGVYNYCRDQEIKHIKALVDPVYFLNIAKGIQHRNGVFGDFISSKVEEIDGDYPVKDLNYKFTIKKKY